MPPERHGALRRADPRQGGVLLVRAKAELTPRVGRPDPLRTHLQKPDSHWIPFPCVLSVFLLFVGRMGGGILFTQTPRSQTQRSPGDDFPSSAALPLT